MKQFIQNELREMKIKRVVGKVGLPQREYRGCQTKIRQTYDEDFILQATSNCMGEKRAQVGNIALKLGLMLMLAEDQELYEAVKVKAQKMGCRLPSYLSFVEQLHRKPLALEDFNNIIDGKTIDGEFCVITED